MSNSRVRPWSERALEAEARIQQLEDALREALQMVEDAGRAYVNYSPERLKHLGSMLSSEAPVELEGEDG